MPDLEYMNDALMLPLPEDIALKKAAGDFEAAVAALDARLAGKLPELLRARLLLEKERLRRLARRYPYNRAEALQKARELIPGMTEERFDTLENQGRINFIYVNGEKRYFLRFAKTLNLFPDIAGRAPDPVSKDLDPIIAKIKKQGKLALRITLEASIGIEEKDFVPGDYTVHLPYPIPCAQQSEIRLLSGKPDSIAPESADQRTAVWHRYLERPEKTVMRYSYVSRIRYADPIHQPAPEAPLYPDELPVSPADTDEEAMIPFTPLLRALCEEITAGADSPVQKAWKIYAYITENVKYSFMRDYFNVDSPAEYSALNGTGDCGLQALMFIALCRIAGIPARWQSALAVEEDGAGSHDWAQFYLEGWGWLFADPSFGGAAYRNGNEERRAFYFGNLDPMRMVANRRFAAPFHEPLGAVRTDPTDNQGGEIALKGAALPFMGPEIDDNVDTISIEEIQ